MIEHRSSKLFNDIIKGLNSTIYYPVFTGSNLDSKPDGMFTSELDGRLVSCWSDPKRFVKKLKNIATNYQDNIFKIEDYNKYEGDLSNHAVFNEIELVKFINNERFLIEIRTDDFKIMAHKLASKYQIIIEIRAGKF